MCRSRPDVGAIESPRGSETEIVASSVSADSEADSEADESIRSPWPPASSENPELSIIIEKLVRLRLSDGGFVLDSVT